METRLRTTSEREVLDGNTHQALGINCLSMELPLGEDIQGIPGSDRLCIFGLFPFAGTR